MDTDVIKEDKLCAQCSTKLIGNRVKFCSHSCKKDFKVVNTVRRCKDCDKTPEETQFASHPYTFDKLSIVCKSCNRLRTKLKEDAHSEEEKLRISERRKTEIYKDTVLTRKYGILVQNYKDMLIEQNNACKICLNTFDSKNSAHIDHNHETGKVRGLLCRTCNFGLGSFHDSIEKIFSAIKYVKFTQNPQHIDAVAKLLFMDGEKRINLRQIRPVKISNEGRIRLIQYQNNCCAICNKDLSNLSFLKMNIDHNHTEGYIRGMLCKTCNTGIGLLYEDTRIFNAAIEYLQTTSD